MAATQRDRTYAVDGAVPLESALNGLVEVDGRVDVCLGHLSDRAFDRLTSASLQLGRQSRLYHRPVGRPTRRRRRQRQRPAARGRSTSNTDRFHRRRLSPRHRLDRSIVVRLTSAWHSRPSSRRAATTRSSADGQQRLAMLWYCTVGANNCCMYASSTNPTRTSNNVGILAVLYQYSHMQSCIGGGHCHFRWLNRARQ